MSRHVSSHESACHHTCPRVIKRIWTADVTRVVSEEAEDTEYGGCCPRPPHYITAGWGGDAIFPGVGDTIHSTIYQHRAFSANKLIEQHFWFSDPLHSGLGRAEIALCEREGSTIIPTHSQFGVLD